MLGSSWHILWWLIKSALKYEPSNLQPLRQMWNFKCQVSRRQMSNNSYNTYIHISHWTGSTFGLPDLIQPLTLSSLFTTNVFYYKCGLRLLNTASSMSMSPTSLVEPTKKPKFGFNWSQIQFGHFTYNAFPLSCLVATLLSCKSFFLLSFDRKLQNLLPQNLLS